MVEFAYLVLFTFPFIVAYLFNRNSRKGVLFALLFSSLFLPERMGFNPTGLPAIGKGSIPIYTLLVLVPLLDMRSIRALRLKPVDFLWVIYLAILLASSLSSGYGVYDGFSRIFKALIKFVIPYFLGRIYFGNQPGTAKICYALLLAALIYVPLCLFEVRMSPQLHGIVYGSMGTGQFVQNVRDGGFRPVVFMGHGLSVAKFMALSLTIACVLFTDRIRPIIARLTAKKYLSILTLTTYLTKTKGAYVYALMGAFGAVVRSRRYFSIFIMVIILAIPTYLITRTVIGWDGQQLLDAAAIVTNPDRVASLNTRVTQERDLIVTANKRPLLGWGTFGASRIKEGRDTDKGTITDSTWIIELGAAGYLGLFSLYAALLAPIAFAFRRAAGTLDDKSFTYFKALALFAVLNIFDTMLNSAIFQIGLLATGALVSCAYATSTQSVKRLVTPSRAVVPRRTRFV